MKSIPAQNQPRIRGYRLFMARVPKLGAVADHFNARRSNQIMKARRADRAGKGLMPGERL